MPVKITMPKREDVKKTVVIPVEVKKSSGDICDEMSLSEAVEQNIVVLKEDFDKLVAEEVAKKKEQLRKEIAAEQAEKKIQSSLHTIEDFLKNTGLSDIEFGKRLLRMGIPHEYLTCLRDEHINLDDKALWAWIRNNYKPNKK